MPRCGGTSPPPLLAKVMQSSLLRGSLSRPRRCMARAVSVLLPPSDVAPGPVLQSARLSILSYPQSPGISLGATAGRLRFGQRQTLGFSNCLWNRRLESGRVGRFTLCSRQGRPIGGGRHARLAAAGGIQDRHPIFTTRDHAAGIAAAFVGDAAAIQPRGLTGSPRRQPGALLQRPRAGFHPRSC
jgi:hypothetical protein